MINLVSSITFLYLVQSHFEQPFCKGFLDKSQA